METSALRTRVEESLRGRISSPFAIRGSSVTALAPCGISEIDELTGGLPRGCVTEILGPPGSGRSSFLVSVLAGMTRRKEFCVLVDGRSSFDPRGAQAAGVALERLLWVRCSNIEETLRGADLLLHGGGFGMVAVDLCDLPASLVRRVPMSTWFRFRQLVENTPTVCLLMGQQAGAKSCAALVMRLEMQVAKWRGEPEGSGCENPQRVLLEGMEAGAEVVLRRMERNAFEKDGSHGARGAEEGQARKNEVKPGVVKQGVAGTNARCRFETVAEWAHLGKEAEEEEARREREEALIAQKGMDPAARKEMGRERERQRSFAPRPRLFSRFEVANFRTDLQTGLRTGVKKGTGRNIGSQG